MLQLFIDSCRVSLLPPRVVGCRAVVGVVEEVGGVVEEVGGV